MLIGEFEAKLTDKNRIAVPKSFREEFEGNIVMSRGYEGCLILLDEKLWSDLLKLINVEPILNLSVRDTKRFILGGAVNLDLDAQGRFVLPSSLREYAEIDTEVSFLGLQDWVEVWSKDRWQEKLSGLKQEASDIADKLTKLNNK